MSGNRGAYAVSVAREVGAAVSREERAHYGAGLKEMYRERKGNYVNGRPLKRVNPGSPADIKLLESKLGLEPADI